MANHSSQNVNRPDQANLYLKYDELLTKQENAPPYNAEGFSLDLQNFEIVLGDSVHTVKSTSIQVSSLDQFIKAEKVSITPDFSKEAQDYYEIGLDNLELVDADIDRILDRKSVV